MHFHLWVQGCSTFLKGGAARLSTLSGALLPCSAPLGVVEGFLLLAIVLSSATAVSAQLPRRMFEVVGVEHQGRQLMTAATHDVISDHRGRLWYCTWGLGIMRYDGYNFHPFHYDPRDSTSLSSNRVSQLLEDSGGDIWAATLDGLSRLDLRTGRFSRYRLPSERTRVTAVFQLSDNTMLVGEHRGMWALNTDTRQMKRWRPLSGSDPEKEPEVTAFLHTTDGGLWAGSTRGLLRLYPDRQAYEHLLIRATDPSDSLSCTALMQDRAGRIWVGTMNGLFRFFPETQRFERASLPDSLSHRPVSDVLEDADGSLWFGNQGLIHWTPGSATIEFFYSPQQAMGIMPSAFNALCRDTFGNLWIATGFGLRKTNTRPPNFRLYQMEIGADLPANRTYWCVEDEHGGIFFHGSKGTRYAAHLGQPTERVTLVKGQRLSGFKQAVSRSPEGQFWTAWLDGGLGIWRPNRRRFEPFLPDTAFHHRRIEGHCHDRNNPNILWLGFRDGIWRMDKKTRERQFFKPPKVPPGGLCSGELCDDGHGGLWFDSGGNYGLGFLDKTSGQYRFFRYDPARSDSSILNNEVLDLSVASDGSVWVALVGGISHLTRNDALAGGFQVQNFTRDHGLRTDQVFSVEADVAGDVWMASSEYITRYRPSDGSFAFFDIVTPFGARNVVRKSMTMTSSGCLYICSQVGVVVCDPAHLTRDEVAPNVVLTDVLINNRALEVGAEFADMLTLGPYENAITFEFSGIHTVSPVSNQYLYQLQGYDTGWVSCSSDLRRAVYTNLPHGHYVFKVKCANPDGVWSEETQLTFFILPPFWEAQWFRFLILLVVSAIIYAVLYTRLKQRQLAQQKELAEQKARYKSLFLANMSHEIRTPMNAILGLSRLLEGQVSDPRQREYLGAIRHSSEDLLRIVNDILDYSKIESGRFSFQSKSFDLKVILGHLNSTFSFRAQDKGIDFQIVVKKDVPTALEGDPVRLMQILGNLTGNAVKFTDKGGVTVEVEALTPELHIQSPAVQPLRFVVRDTGVGIPPDQLDAVFESFNQVSDEDATAKGGTGLGLSIAKQLVEQQGGRIQLRSVQGEGTEVAFELLFGLSATAPAPSVEEEDNVGKTRDELKNLRVLLVEDTYFNQILAIELLKSKLEGVQIEIAENGQIALEKVMGTAYDLVLMDVKMPVMDGLEATRRLRQHADPQVRALRIVGLTANAIPEELEKCRLAGMNRWVTKPIQLEELMAAIVEVMHAGARP